MEVSIQIKEAVPFSDDELECTRLSRSQETSVWSILDSFRFLNGKHPNRSALLYNLLVHNRS